MTDDSRGEALLLAAGRLRGSAAIAGVDLRTLAARIGHTDLSMLQKHYAAVMGSASEEAADKIENAFHGSYKNLRQINVLSGILSNLKIQIGFAGRI